MNDERNVAEKFDPARGEGVQDAQGRTSMGGIPLYYTDLTFSYTGTKDKTLQLIHYLEQESKGCYFIDSLSMSEIEDSKEYATSFNVTLYYFDTTKQAVNNTDSTDSTEPTT